MQKVIGYLKVILPFLALAIGALSSVSVDDEGRASEVAQFLNNVQTGLRAIIDGDTLPAPTPPESAPVQKAATKKAATKKAATKKAATKRSR